MAQNTSNILNLTLTETIHFFAREIEVTAAMLDEVASAGYPRTLDGARRFATDGMNSLLDEESFPEWAAVTECVRNASVEHTDVAYSSPRRLRRSPVLIVTAETVRETVREREEVGLLTREQAQAVLEHTDQELVDAMHLTMSSHVHADLDRWYSAALESLA